MPRAQAQALSASVLHTLGTIRQLAKLWVYYIRKSWKGWLVFSPWQLDDRAATDHRICLPQTLTCVPKVPWQLMLHVQWGRAVTELG